MKRLGCILSVFLLFPMVCPAMVIETIEAIVNNELILSGEVQAQADAIIFRNRGQVSSVGDEYRMTVWNQVLDAMIDDLLIMQEIRKSLSEEKQEQIRKYIEEKTNFEMDQIRRQYNTPAKLAQRQQLTGMSWVEERQTIQRLIYRQYIRETIANQFTNMEVKPVTQEEIEAFKKSNPDEQPDGSVKIAMILLKFPPNATPEDELKVLDRAEELTQRARSGEPFETLAIQYSQDDASKMSGGHIAAIWKKGEVKEFDPIFVLKKDEIADPIRRNTGYTIIKITDKDTIENRIEKRKKEININNWIDELHKKAKIDVRERLATNSTEEQKK